MEPATPRPLDRAAPPPDGLRAVWLLTCVPVILIFVVGLAYKLSPRGPKYGDYTQDWLSARNYWNGQSVYGPLGESFAEHLLPGANPESYPLAVNAHPPVSILLLLPLGRLDFPTARLVFNVLNLVAVAASLVLIGSRAGLGLHPWRWLPLAALLLSSSPLASQVSQGQFNGMLLLCIVVAWIAARQERWGWAGAMAGLAAALKLFPAYLVVYFALRGAWKAVAMAALVFIGLHALAAWQFGLDDLTRYVTDALPAVQIWRASWLNASLQGYWCRLFDSTIPHVVPLVQAPLVAKALYVASAAVVTAAVAWNTWKAKSRGQCDLAFAACVLGMLLVSPTTWNHYWLLALLPLSIVWYETSPGLLGRAALLAAIVALVTIPPGQIWDRVIPAGTEVVRSLQGSGVPLVAHPWHSLVYLGYPTYLALGLWLTAMCARRSAATELPAEGAAP